MQTITLAWPVTELSQNGPVKWDCARDDLLRLHHGTLPIPRIASMLGTTRASIKARVTRLGISKQILWAEEDVRVLTEAYAAAGHDGVIGLSALSVMFGKTKSSICLKAKKLGLGTNPSRRMVEERKSRKKFATLEDAYRSLGDSTRKRLAMNGHPRGMLGKKHTAEALLAIGAASSAQWASISEQERADRTLKAIQTRRANLEGCAAPKIARGTWKAGWREIGGKRKYFRSRWEANYARYLQWLKDRGIIAEWAHEPETFWFITIKRGVRSYLPDFRVWENNGSSCLHEVKGWMDGRSKTTLARMAKYHPKEKIVLIDGPQYRAIRSKVAALIPDWEDSARDTHA